MVSHDVVKPGKHTKTLGYLRVHRSVYIIQQIQGLGYQLVSLLQEALLYLRLTRRVKVKCVGCLPTSD